MKLTKILLSSSIALTPAVILPLVNATKVNNNTTKKEAKKTNTNDVIVVDAEGWVSIDGTSKYHVTFNNVDKTCEIDQIAIYSDLKVTIGAEYKTSPSSDIFKLIRIDTFQKTSGGGTITCLDLSRANYLEEICPRAFDRNDKTNSNACSFKIAWVKFSGAESLRTIGDWAFRNQNFDRNDKNQDLDFSNTSLYEIGKYAFSGCCNEKSKNKTINSIIFSQTLAFIGDNAFGELDNKDNNLAAKRIMFLSKEAPCFYGDKCIPNIDETVKDKPCVYVPNGTKEKYWANMESHLEQQAKVGILVQKSNIRESAIKFNSNYGEKGVGEWQPHIAVGHAGIDNKGTWYPVDAATGEKVTGAKVWLVDDLNGTIQLTLEENDEYRLSWTADVPVGKHTVAIMAMIGSGETLSMAIRNIYFTVNKCTLDGGSNVVYANHLAGEDFKQWTPHLSHESIQSTMDVKWEITSSSPAITSDVVEMKKDPSNPRLATLVWKDNLIEDGWYDLQISATFYGETLEKFRATTPVRFFMGNTYYDIDIYDETGKHPEGYVNINKNDGAKTFNVQCSASGQPTEFIWSPALSIERDGITKEKVQGSTGAYKITIDPTKLPIGSYELYTYAYVYLPRTNKDDIKYPIYSNSLKFNIIETADPQFPTCTGGSEELETYNKEAGQDTKFWTLSKYTKEEQEITGKIANLNFVKTSWSPISDERMKHLGADSWYGDKFRIKWDETFSSLVKPYETVEFNAEFDAIYEFSATEDLKVHMVVPVSISIWNYGETKSEAGKNIYGVPKRAGDVEQPWLMYSNKSTTPVTTQVDYYLVEDEDFPEAQSGKITLKNHEGEINSTYLSYESLPEGIYGFYIYGYDEENVATAYQHVVLRITNIAIIDGLPSTLTINKGDGKYETPIQVYLNGEIFTGATTYTLGNVDKEKMWIDDKGYLCWSSKLDIGVYDPIIYATITVEDKTIDTLPIYIAVTVNPAPNGTNVGAIIGGTVGGVVGAAGIGTGSYFGIKKYKTSKAKK